MRPAIRIALLGLLVAAVVGAPASAEAGRHGPGRSGVDAHASAGSAVQGGTLVVGVRVRLPRGAARDGVSPTATAVVHFASGDVSVDLTGRARAARGHRFGGRAWWSPVRAWTGVARVPVAADEQVGRVTVDVTVTVGDASVTVTTFGRIRAPRHGHTPAPTPTPDPTPVPCTSGCQEL